MATTPNAPARAAQPAQPAPPARPEGAWRRFSGAFPTILAVLVALNGVVSLILGLFVDVWFRSDNDFLMVLSSYVEVWPSLGWATVMFLMAAALAARKRVAWGLVLTWTVLMLLLLLMDLVLSLIHI